jgi:hypothetical protein
MFMIAIAIVAIGRDNPVVRIIQIRLGDAPPRDPILRSASVELQEEPPYNLAILAGAELGLTC